MNKFAYILLSLLLFLSCGGSSEEIEMSDKDPGTKVDPSETLSVDVNTEYQEIIGFGGMNTKWQASTLSDSEVATLYGKENGQLGYNVLRVRISPNGENDWKQILTTVKKAKSLGAMILATPWTPPANLKTNQSIVQGELADYAGYVTWLKRFVQYMKDISLKQFLSNQ